MLLLLTGGTTCSQSYRAAVLCILHVRNESGEPSRITLGHTVNKQQPDVIWETPGPSRQTLLIVLSFTEEETNSSEVQQRDIWGLAGPPTVSSSCSGNKALHPPRRSPEQTLHGPPERPPPKEGLTPDYTLTEHLSNKDPWAGDRLDGGKRAMELLDRYSLAAPLAS